MTQIRHRSTILVHLVEHVISEQLDNVPVTRLGPPRIMVESDSTRHAKPNRVSQSAQLRDSERASKCEPNLLFPLTLVVR